VDPLERRIARLYEQFGEAESISTLEDVAEGYVSTFADTPLHIREIARAETAHVLSLGDGPQTEDERRWLVGLPPTRQAKALLLYRLLWRRGEGMPDAMSERVLWISQRHTVPPD
jgi:hypothetical protein